MLSDVSDFDDDMHTVMRLLTGSRPEGKDLQSDSTQSTVEKAHRLGRTAMAALFFIAVGWLSMIVRVWSVAMVLRSTCTEGFVRRGRCIVTRWPALVSRLVCYSGHLMVPDAGK